MNESGKDINRGDEMRSHFGMISLKFVQMTFSSLKASLVPVYVVSETCLLLYCYDCDPVML